MLCSYKLLVTNISTVSMMALPCMSQIREVTCGECKPLDTLKMQWVIYFWYIQKVSIAFHIVKKLEIFENSKSVACVQLMTLDLKGGRQQKASELSKIHLKVSSHERSQWDVKQCAMWKVRQKRYNKYFLSQENLLHNVFP